MSVSDTFSPNNARKLAERIRQIGKEAQTEEDVRVHVEHALRPVLQELGILTKVAYEQKISTLHATGRADAVYGFGIIEYERPGKLSTDAGREEVIEQLSKYLIGKARELAPANPEEPIKKMLGIGIDGDQILYLRYAASENRAKFFQPISLETQLEFFKAKGVKTGGFQIVGPMPVSKESVDWLLYSLRFFSRLALEPEALAKAFGPDADIASRIVNLLYKKLTSQENPRVSAFYAQWNMIFGVIYGQDLDKGETAARALAKLYRIEQKPDLKRILFSVHTYYVLLMKMLAAELVSLQEGSWFTSFTADIQAVSDDIVRSKITNLENGGLFRQFNIVNFLEGDFFRWYLDLWDPSIAQAIRHLAIELQQFEPATSTINPDSTRDLLKKLYQYLLPKNVRHDLGEYYTPDWLAERLILEVGYDGNPSKRVLDPSCGSGTFLALCIRKAFEYADDHLIRPSDLVQKLLTNIVGFDLNPLAVIAARTNFLLALGTLIRHAPRIEIPVYFCDSILTPTEFAQQSQMEFISASVQEGSEEMILPKDRMWYVDTSEGRFTFPSAVVKKESIETVCLIIEESIEFGRDRTKFVGKLQKEISNLEPSSIKLLSNVYDQISKLNKEGKNGIWARFLKNQFAPVFIGTSGFDYIIGNPPWVNWQSLSEAYRSKTYILWQKYGLFSLSGQAARLGGGKKDLAMLFTYVCLENYVRIGGKLGFIITQTLFKTEGAGAGFRRFKLGDKEPFKILKVEDLSEFNPFEGAANRTAIVTIMKGEETTYPVDYVLWRKKAKCPIRLEDNLSVVLDKVELKNWQAQPVDSPSNLTSPWLSARPKALSAIQKAIGKSQYRAYAGSCTWANGVFWMGIKHRISSSEVIAENLHDIGKLEDVPQVEHAIEAELLYPLLRGRDLGRWLATPSAHILNVQDTSSRCGIDEERMKDEFPSAYKYLLKFKHLLSGRSGFKKYFCKEEKKGKTKKLEVALI